ncbi:MAG: class I SAM-dependent methyltransferase, partial [Pirellulaceae bacterium]
MTSANFSDQPKASVDDPFHTFYDREEPAYGMQPSAELAAFLRQCKPRGEALDLGAGAGRDSLAMADAGLHVTAVDISRRGLDRVRERASVAGTADKINTVASDVRAFRILPRHYQVIVATTVLDHLPMDDAGSLWQAMVAGLAEGGMLYVEVHTTDDPGSSEGAGAVSDAPVSETADQVINYFPPGRLVEFAVQADRLRILRYEERLEWDYTHGPEHQHGKAAL